MADEPEIRYGIPLPPLSIKGPSLFERVGVGGSFVVPLNGERVDIVHAYVDREVRRYNRKLGATFTTRRVDGGIGVWRVK